MYVRTDTETGFLYLWCLEAKEGSFKKNVMLNIARQGIEDGVIESAIDLIKADAKFACKLLIKLTGRCNLHMSAQENNQTTHIPQHGITRKVASTTQMTTTKKTVSGKHFRSYSARIDGLISKSNSQAFYFPGPLSSDSYEDSSMVVGNTDRLQKQFSLDSDENISIDYNRDGAFLRNKISSRHKRPLYAVGSKELREWFKENDFGVTNMSEMLVPIKSSGLVDDKINELENDSITKIKPLYTVTTRNQSNNPTNALSSEDYGEDTIRPFTTTIAPTPTTSLFQEVDGDLTDSQPNKIKIKPSYVQPDTLEMLISALEYAVTPLDSHGVQEDFQPENKANVLERDAAEQKEIFDSSIQNSNTLYNSETSLATSTTTVPPLTDVIFTQNNVDNGVEEDLLIALEYATAHPNSNDNNDVNKVQLDPEPVQTNIAYENAHEYEPYNNIL
uniref:Uncharacterized protein n=1 Tax=Acrobeloides nanus TaxID=290746 RepID=A0A914CUH6_9BILA